MDYKSLSRQLPETMPQAEIISLLEVMYGSVVQRTIAGKELQGRFMCELADKQWHNYMPLPAEAQSAATAFVKVMLRPPVSQDLAESLLGFILRLGLQEAFLYLGILAAGAYRPTLSRDFIDELQSMPDDISDPYGDFRGPGQGLPDRRQHP